MMDALRRAPQRIADALSVVCAVAAGLAFLAIFVVNIGQIAIRSTVGGGWIWVTDLSQLLFIWLVMLGTAAAYYQRNHIVVDFVAERLRGLNERAVVLLTRVIEVGLFAVLLRAGLEVTRVRGGIAYIQLGVPTSWGFAAIPVGAVLMIAFALVLPLRGGEGASASVEPVVDEGSEHG